MSSTARLDIHRKALGILSDEGRAASLTTTTMKGNIHIRWNLGYKNKYTIAI